MKQDHSAFASSRPLVADAYCGDVADRVRRFLPMVRRLAWHVHGSGRPGIELEDLMQSGLVALTECAQRHEGPGEDGFAAYAKMRVRGAMVDMIRRTVTISRGGAERRRMLAAKESELRGRLGREPDAPETAEALGISVEDLASLRASSEPVRLEPIDEVYSDANMAFADETPDSLSLLQDEEMRGHLAVAIAALPERLQMVVQLYFVEELNLSEIAEVLGVSIPRVHQIKAQALGKLREKLGGVAEII
ncbi:DNA-directed RNA polymerase sigma-70 factor [Novosphingobium marinum]|uniref:RNA polymerase sigma factor for flagellar operon FliA n=1 Tax=Novosphingobium marinum TaxID=1514948 RepID=A0A7Y9XXD3_9SPHN|nr:sigma-70 family RNA polymerase sigma factor [Novosphingobium marinum]NYH95018.1 RNA polymerase sigma factor for flagellar operon FliA [Novosphingobium marinum]GGC40829.1 DNA-directed RNA polymerase sigma-70 factor [Novosphingobium marinum]